MEKLYEEYGKLMIELEIIQAKISEVKKNIVLEINEEAENGNNNKS